MNKLKYILGLLIAATTCHIYAGQNINSNFIGVWVTSTKVCKEKGMTGDELDGMITIKNGVIEEQHMETYQKTKLNKVKVNNAHQLLASGIAHWSAETDEGHSKASYNLSINNGMMIDHRNSWKYLKCR